jgi:isopentenyl-diphosphate Delta-isomerase
VEPRSYQEAEAIPDFEKRKRDHIEIALRESVQGSSLSDLDRIELVHEALPDLNFKDVDLSVKALGLVRKTPFLVSSMTAGHRDSATLNQVLAVACADRGWMMGVGSQRRELSDEQALMEWKRVREAAPGVSLIGNLGIAQVIRTSTEAVLKLVQSLGAEAMIVHLNPLQEVIQLEGNTDFSGGLKAIERLCRELPIPVIVKETGCGISVATARRLQEAGVAVVDVSGSGGTHWGRVEGERAQAQESLKARVRAQAAATFANWGIPTARSVQDIVSAKVPLEVWASGGVRSGLDASKLIAIGARVVGFAKPVLSAALKGEVELHQFMEKIEFEARVALFCTGSKNFADLRARGVVKWH